jgi:hypothetical protein
VGFVVAGESEASTEVLSEKGLLGVLNILHNGFVDALLGSESIL